MRPVHLSVPALAVAAALTSIFATGALAQEELRDGPALTTRQAHDALGELQKEHAADFTSIATGAGIGLALLLAIHSLWKRRPVAARVIVVALLCAAMARMMGLMVMYGDVNTSSVSTGIVAAILVFSLVLSFRIPVETANRRVRMPWLAVEARPRKEEEGAESGRTADAAKTEEPDEAKQKADAALALIDAGKIDEAIAELRASIALRDNKRARVHLATVLGAKGEAGKALEELDAALAIDPDYVEALAEKHHVHKALGNTEAAAEAKTKLREARAARRNIGSKAVVVSKCPSCDRDVKPGDRKCECGLSLATCGECGREGVELFPRDEKLICRKCRSADAASHAKKSPKLDTAQQEAGMPAWMAAVAFSTAVMLGSILSPAYSWWRARAAAGQLRDLAERAEVLADAPLDGPTSEVIDLSRRRTKFFLTNDFLKRHPASLKVALAVHAVGRSRELAVDEPELGAFVAGWAGRRAKEAKVAVDSNYGERLRGGLWLSFSQIRNDLEREIEIRRAQASGTEVAVRPASDPGIEKEWEAIWVRPRVGTVFYVEAFRRVSVADRKGPSVVGEHADGSALAAAGVLKVEVTAAAPGSSGVAMALDITSLPFEVKRDVEHPLGVPPSVMIAPKADGKAGRRYRAEYGPKCAFVALYDLAGDETEIVATRASVHAIGDLPLKSIPYYAPGMDASWEETESQFRPYGLASATKGQSVKQITRWAPGSGGKPRIAIGWLLRYVESTRSYTERIVQSWSSGRPWWDFYDNEVYFFRTRFDEPK